MVISKEKLEATLKNLNVQMIEQKAIKTDLEVQLENVKTVINNLVGAAQYANSLLQEVKKEEETITPTPVETKSTQKTKE